MRHLYVEETGTQTIGHFNPSIPRHFAQSITEGHFNGESSTRNLSSKRSTIVCHFLRIDPQRILSQKKTKKKTGLVQGISDWQERPLDICVGTWLLGFLRNVDCLQCHVRYKKLLQAAESLRQAGVSVALVLQNTGTQVQELTGDGSPFFIICDPDGSLYEAWGVEAHLGNFFMSLMDVSSIWAGWGQGPMTLNQRGTLTQMPADFVLRDGVVSLAHYGTRTGDHLPIEKVLEQ